MSPFPTHVPSNGFRLGAGEDVFAFVELSEFSLALGFTVRFGFGLTDCSGAGVGDSSEIGAGARCVVLRRSVAVRQNARVRFIRAISLKLRHYPKAKQIDPLSRI